ncbi:hypothetical protein [Capnocytophaga catalasegens]|nr:hypothetical protein [Capnocytophaga catalasegens]
MAVYGIDLMEFSLENISIPIEIKKEIIQRISSKLQTTHHTNKES